MSLDGCPDALRQLRAKLLTGSTPSGERCDGPATADRQSRPGQQTRRPSSNGNGASTMLAPSRLELSTARWPRPRVPPLTADSRSPSWSRCPTHPTQRPDAGGDEKRSDPLRLNAGLEQSLHAFPVRPARSSLPVVGHVAVQTPTQRRCGHLVDLSRTAPSTTLKLSDPVSRLSAAVSIPGRGRGVTPVGLTAPLRSPRPSRQQPSPWRPSLRRPAREHRRGGCPRRLPADDAPDTSPSASAPPRDPPQAQR